MNNAVTLVVEEAKGYILGHGYPKGMALSARSGRKIPVTFTGHREAGGYIIDSAKIDYTGFTDQEIINYANELKIEIGLRKKYSKLSLSEFLNRFSAQA